MSEKRKKYDREFREAAVRIMHETGKPIAQVARDLGVNEGARHRPLRGPTASRSAFSEAFRRLMTRCRVASAEPATTGDNDDGPDGRSSRVGRSQGPPE